MQDYSQQLDVKKASAIRQLLIRPYAYLFAKINQLMQTWLRTTSVGYLSQSQLTQNQTADIVASNYFVTRRQGTYAKGVVTLTCTASSVRVTKGAQFTIDGHIFVTQKTTIASISPLQDTEDINYTRMYSINGQYKTNVPVVSVVSGYMEIPEGALVTVSSYISNVSQAQLTSPITGGAQSQTDASMMSRCKDRCGSAIGTLGALRIKMQEAPVQVMSCNAISSKDPGCFRARNNNLDIPYGGIVDVYVKTANQTSFSQLLFQQMEHDSDGYYIQVSVKDDRQIAGFTRVTKVLSAQQGTQIGTYTVQYGSSNTLVSAQAARLTVYQTAKIRFRQSLTASVPVQVTVQYVNGITDLQQYMDSSSGAFLGQDCLVKAAVPATVHISGYIHSTQPITQNTLQSLKVFISQYVNSKQVGDYILNMAQVAQALHQQYPDINLRLPYGIQTSLPMTNGGNYNFTTSDGQIDLTYRQGLYMWDPQAYYFSTVPTYITLEVL